MRTYFRRNYTGIPATKIIDIWIKRAFAMQYGVKSDTYKK